MPISLGVLLSITRAKIDLARENAKMTVRMMSAEVNGKRIGFSSDTEFLVQTSKTRNRKSGYETRYKFTGEQFQRMAMHYSGINIGNGYRKRVVMAGKVIIREASY